MYNPSPLADRMRPGKLDEFVGQSHLLGRGKPLRQLIKQGKLTSIILWGPPGTGKTTLARIIAGHWKADFIPFSAVSTGLADLRKVIERVEGNLRLQTRTVLFVDEIHRWNKSQQDALLPHVESGVLVLIGATTENPSFEVNSALLSRCHVMRLRELEEADMQNILDSALADTERGVGAKHLSLEPPAREFLVAAASGDARALLNMLEVISELSQPKQIVSRETIEAALARRAPRYDKGGEEHYNVISAFIKSLRGSDADAAIYYLARMIEAGEDPVFIARRMVVFASEDIGNADPHALLVAMAALDAVRVIGLPEARINLAQAVTFLAGAPKSNASYAAIDSAIAEVRRSGALPVPLHLRNAPSALMKKEGYHRGYQYAHAQPGQRVSHHHLPDAIKRMSFYDPSDHGHEAKIRQRLSELARSRQQDSQIVSRETIDERDQNVSRETLPIGVLDSGIGGLSLVESVRRLLPRENVRYLADHAHAPYGNKAIADVETYVMQSAKALYARGIKVMVVACNTATTALIARLREAYPGLPIVGIVPMIKPAARHTKTGTIAVLATSQTLASQTYRDLRRSYAKGTTVLDIVCDHWVPMIESAKLDRQSIRTTVDECRQHGADVIVLGCTHFPLIRPEMEKAAPSHLTILDSSDAVARQLKRVLAAEALLRASGQGHASYLTSGSPKLPTLAARRFTGRQITFKKLSEAKAATS